MYKILLIWLLATTALVAQTSKLTQHIENDAIYEHASVGLSVRSLATGAEVVSHRSHKLLAPASSLKLITTLTALQHLGDNYTYTTTLSYSGSISSDGTLSGDLILTGSGDPTLGSSRYGDKYSYPVLLKAITSAVKKAGITCIDGKVIADPTIYSGQEIADEWNYNDMGNYYASGAWGININENLYYLYFKGGTAQGHKARISHTAPLIMDMSLQSEVVTAAPKTGDHAYIYGAPYQKQRIVRGTIPAQAASFAIKGAMPNPPLQAAQLIYQALEKASIKVADGYSVGQHKVAQVIHTMTSPPLSAIVTKANHHSINLYCDALLRTTGAVHSKTGSITAGLAAVRDHLKELDLATDEIVLKDGSGLAGENKVTASFMTAYLRTMQQTMGTSVLPYLPQAGSEGTVKRLLRGTAAAKQYYLKSGSFEGVQSYTGYLKGKSGKSYSICFMVNNYTTSYRTMRKKTEQLLTNMYEQL